MAIQPTVFSGINNTGSFVIVNVIDQGKVDNFSSIPEGFCLSAQDLQKNLSVKNNKIIPAKNPLFERPDYWANYNWDKSRFSQLNTEMDAYRPVSGTSGLGTSQINYDIIENVEHVSSTGASSTIVALFSKRPGYVQQFIYKIPSLDTSCYILGKGGADTGMGTNVAEWCLEFSNAPIKGVNIYRQGNPQDVSAFSSVTKYTINFRGEILDDPAEKFKNFRSNQTRGGVAGSFRPEFAGAPYSGIKWYPDASWSQSPTIYRNYTQGLAPNNVASAAFESCIIPFDFISYKGGEDGTVNAGDHGGDLAHPALYRHERYFEKITVNFSGIEGVIHHKMWHHVPRVVPSGEYGQTRYQRDVGPIVPNIFDKGYLYNYYRDEFLDLDLEISGGRTAIGGAAPYLSATVSSCFRNCTYSEFTEGNNLPPARGLSNSTFTQWSTNIFRNDLGYNDTIWGDNGTASNPADDPVNGRRRIWLRNNATDVFNGSGLMFFNWEPFINGFNTGNQELADKACYYALILEKTTGATSFSNPGGRHKPYVASGPFAFGVLAKGDTDLNNYYIDEDAQPQYGQGQRHIIYKGNGLQGDFNEFNWRHSKAVLTSRKNSISAYDTSADGNCLIWHSGFGTVITMGNRDHQKKIPGWGGWQYWIVLGANALEVKEKIKILIESGAAKTKPVFDVPESIVKAVHPIGI